MAGRHAAVVQDRPGTPQVPRPPAPAPDAFDADVPRQRDGDSALSARSASTQTRAAPRRSRGARRSPWSEPGSPPCGGTPSARRAIDKAVRSNPNLPWSSVKTPSLTTPAPGTYAIPGTEQWNGGSGMSGTGRRRDDDPLRSPYRRSCGQAARRAGPRGTGPGARPAVPDAGSVGRAAQHRPGRAPAASRDIRANARVARRSHHAAPRGVAGVAARAADDRRHVHRRADGALPAPQPELGAAAGPARRRLLRRHERAGARDHARAMCGPGASSTRSWSTSGATTSM